MREITVFGSNGDIIVNGDTGEVVRLDGDWREIAAKTENVDMVPVRFDLDEYRLYYGEALPVPVSVDILDLGFWAANGSYSPPMMDWRTDPDIWNVDGIPQTTADRAAKHLKGIAYSLAAHDMSLSGPAPQIMRLVAGKPEGPVFEKLSNGISVPRYPFDDLSASLSAVFGRFGAACEVRLDLAPDGERKTLAATISCVKTAVNGLREAIPCMGTGMDGEKTVLPGKVTKNVRDFAELSAFIDESVPCPELWDDPAWRPQGGVDAARMPVRP